MVQIVGWGATVDPSVQYTGSIHELKLTNQLLCTTTMKRGGGRNNVAYKYITEKSFLSKMRTPLWCCYVPDTDILNYEVKPINICVINLFTRFRISGQQNRCWI